jgi:hypothetical protein
MYLPVDVAVQEFALTNKFRGRNIAKARLIAQNSTAFMNAFFARAVALRVHRTGGTQKSILAQPFCFNRTGG